MGRKKQKYLKHDSIDYGGMMNKNLDAQEGVFNRWLDLESRFGDQVTKMGLDRDQKHSEQFYDILGYGVDRMGDMARGQQSLDRQANIGALRDLGPQAMAAFGAADPRQMEISNMLMDDSIEGLQNRGKLSNIDSRRLTQDAVGLKSAMGFGTGPETIAYATGELQQGRERRMNQSRNNAYRAQTMRNQLYGNPLMGLLSQNANVNPLMALQSNSQLGGYTDQDVLNPESPAGMQLQLADRNARLQTDMANRQIKAQNRANKTANIMDGVKTASQVATLFCWVAREVYGSTNPKWLQFRSYMMMDSPRWLLRIYLRHGERFAQWLKNHAWLKPILRKWMDTKIKD